MFSAEPYLVSIDDNVFISVGARFIPHDGAVLPFRRELPDLDLAAPIHIGANTFVGMGALILKGVTIGPNSIVGANAVVTKSFPGGGVIAGNPARQVKTTEEYLHKALENSLRIGDLPEMEKHMAYKKIFGIE
jgi:acetyltransferase-like isoleucine patch superfamily enzyme